MAMIEAVPSFTIPQSATFHLQIRQAVIRVLDGLVSRYRQHRLEKQLARLDPEVLADIGVPNDHMTRTTGELTRYPTVIKVKVQRI